MLWNPFFLLLISPPFHGIKNTLYPRVSRSSAYRCAMDDRMASRSFCSQVVPPGNGWASPWDSHGLLLPPSNGSRCSCSQPSHHPRIKYSLGNVLNGFGFHCGLDVNRFIPAGVHYSPSSAIGTGGSDASGTLYLGNQSGVGCRVFIGEMFFAKIRSVRVLGLIANPPIVFPSTTHTFFLSGFLIQ